MVVRTRTCEVWQSTHPGYMTGGSDGSCVALAMLGGIVFYVVVRGKELNENVKEREAYSPSHD